MVDTTRYVDELLKLYLSNLPETSETAAAIRREATWEEISQTAEKEGLHYISSAVFTAEEAQLTSGRDTEPTSDLPTFVSARLQEFRKHLPDSCETAAAIDQNAPWTDISQKAENEGLHEIATFIFEAEQQGLES